MAKIIKVRAPARPTPAILVHGGPGAPDGPGPGPAAPLARADFDVYAYHQLGAGLSGRLADAAGYTVARHVEDLEAIRVTLGVEQVVLIGASWGGQLGGVKEPAGRVFAQFGCHLLGPAARPWVR
ncbi:alpha/beta fold hydrolase [Micromonospora sp. NPDC050784]|uniref:alpha/beta fold hydrolase n=1 Tax=Micromonospora sp. NPDC050784 TaxID=3364281 RepID=UPI00378B9698